MSAVTVTPEPPTCRTTSAHTSVEVTTLTGPPDAGPAEVAPQPDSARTAATASGSRADASFMVLRRRSGRARTLVVDENDCQNQLRGRLVEQERRLLDHARHVGQETAGDVTVDHPVVEAGADRRDVPGDDLPVH